MVNNFKQLHERVVQCEIMAELMWFDEEIEDPPALEGGRFAKFVGRNSFQIERQLQDLLNLGSRKVFDPQKVT